MKKVAFLAAAALGTLAACQPAGTQHAEVSASHVPTVSRSVMTHDLSYDGAEQFSVNELAELNEWLSSVEVRYGDRISFDDANPIGSTARQRAVAALIGQRGLLLRENGPVTDPPLGEGTARVVVVRAVASVPECPNHARKSNPEMQGSLTSNYSCASASNLAAMIADPNDLVAGKSYTGSPANTDKSEGLPSGSAAPAAVLLPMTGGSQN